PTSPPRFADSTVGAHCTALAGGELRAPASAVRPHDHRGRGRARSRQRVLVDEDAIRGDHAYLVAGCFGEPEVAVRTGHDSLWLRAGGRDGELDHVRSRRIDPADGVRAGVGEPDVPGGAGR